MGACVSMAACVSGPQQPGAEAPPPPPPLEPAGADSESEQPGAGPGGKRGPAPDPGELPKAKPRGDPAAGGKRANELYDARSSSTNASGRLSRQDEPAGQPPRGDPWGRPTGLEGGPQGVPVDPFGVALLVPGVWGGDPRHSLCREPEVWRGDQANGEWSGKKTYRRQ
jgi:hypothetical protein